jgi:NIPSNAP
MIYESRVYTALPGRMPALLARFENVTLGFWEKYGIHQVGFFTTSIGPNSLDLTYLLAWESLAERERKWNAFAADPEWLSARAKTEANGPIVAKVTNYILAPTPYSSVQ